MFVSVKAIDQLYTMYPFPVMAVFFAVNSINSLIGKFQKKRVCSNLSGHERIKSPNPLLTSIMETIVDFWVHLLGTKWKA